MDVISMQGNVQQGVRTLLENEICLSPPAGKGQLLICSTCFTFISGKENFG